MRITGGTIKPSIQRDIDCVHCDKHGNEKFEMMLTDVCHMEGISLNLRSISRVLKQGWNIATTKESIVMNKGALKICFHIIIPTKCAFYCAYFDNIGKV